MPLGITKLEMTCIVKYNEMSGENKTKLDLRFSSSNTTFETNLHCFVLHC